MGRKHCPNGHTNTAYLGRDSYGDRVYECYGCGRGAVKFVMLGTRKPARKPRRVR